MHLRDMHQGLFTIGYEQLMSFKDLLLHLAMIDFEACWQTS